MRALLTLVAGFLLVPGAAVASAAPADPAVHCGSMTRIQAPDTVLSNARLVGEREALPAFCQLEGRIASRVGFVMRLPVNGWNGKFAVTGCGGFCGSLIPDKPGYSNSMNEALRAGFAVIQTDGGHTAPSWDTDWALADDVALRLYAGAWMPLAVAAGRRLVEGFYARAPRRTYFSGCSNGGRLGLFAAQRYPALFDGIAAGGGIFDLTGTAGVHGLWFLQAVRDEQGRAVIDQRKLPRLAAHVMAQCDAMDGVPDQVVSQPLRCQPELESLQCEAGANSGAGAVCFTAAELTAIRRLYQGATVDGRQLFAAVPPGSERLWARWLVGTDEDPAWGERATEGNLRLTYGIPADQPFDPHEYRLADELVRLQRLAPVLNATDPDLSGFAAAGGKLLYYHGLADPLILPGRARQYYEDVVAGLGEQQLDEFALFVLVPGHGHCWEQPGVVADDFDPLQVVDQWVESGRAPGYILAVQKDQRGQVLRSRKLCPLPGEARFEGGDMAHADSFRCINPNTGIR